MHERISIICGWILIFSIGLIGVAGCLLAGAIVATSLTGCSGTGEALSPPPPQPVAQGVFDDAELAIEDLKSRVALLETRVDTFGQTQQSQHDRISSLETRAGEQGAALADHEARISALENSDPPPPDPTPDPVDKFSMFISHDELMALPTSGPAWEQLRDDAYGSWGQPNLSDQNYDHNTDVLAGALVSMRVGDNDLFVKTRTHILNIPETENGGRTLALGRNLCAYIVAASIIGLKNDTWDAWLDGVRTEDLSGKTLIFTHEDRPNNWGTHAGASRIAAAIWLGDDADLQRAASVFKGWLGDRSSYAGFDFTSPHEEWQADPNNPVAVNPAGATRHGRDFDGILPDDIRRGGGFDWPPGSGGIHYTWAALNGVLLQAELLHRQGYDAYEWEDQAVRRAVAWLYRHGYGVEGEDEEWLVHIVNHRYGTDYAVPVPARVGKPWGYSDWTHQ